jgi:hypothetical protein
MIEWIRGWRPLDDERRRRYLEGELGWELAENPRHVLAGRKWEVVGLFGVYDDLIVRLDGREEFAWVHLAWNREDQPRWPHTEILGGVPAVNRFLHAWEPLPSQDEYEDEDAEPGTTADRSRD